MEYQYSHSLVPIFAKNEFDMISQEFLRKHAPYMVEEPQCLDVDQLVNDLGLIVERHRLSEDFSIYGQIFFSEGLAEVYLEKTDEFITRKVKAGTVFIDSDVIAKRNIGCERNTIVHECIHWRFHSLYHTLQSAVNTKIDLATAHRCQVSKVALSDLDGTSYNWSDEDWMEWQANNLAPRILMPKDSFIEVATYFSTLSYPKPALVEKLASFYDVSRQSASIRFNELFP